MNKLLLIFLASVSVAAGPKYNFKDPNLNDELTNVYHDIANVFSVSTVTLRGLQVSTISISSLQTGIALGKVKQVVKATTTSPTSTTSSTYQNTSLTANITPTSASSTILVIVSGGSLRNAAPATTNAQLTLARGGSNLVGALGLLSVGTTSLTTGVDIPTTFAYVDSPAATSSLTYTVQVRSSDNASSVSFNVQSETASIVLMEIL